MKAWYMILIVVVALLLQGCSSQQEEKLFAGGMGSVCFATSCFEVKIADSPAERSQGLMYEEELEDDHGMLFVFEAPKPRIMFRMKNVRIPLDIVWLNSEGDVVYIEENIHPCQEGTGPCPTFGPKSASIIGQYVLEINAGKVKEMGLQVGDRMELNY